MIHNREIVLSSEIVLLDKLPCSLRGIRKFIRFSDRSIFVIRILEHLDLVTTCLSTEKLFPRYELFGNLSASQTDLNPFSDKTDKQIFDVLEMFIKTTILISNRILRDFKNKIGYKLRVKLVYKSIVAVVRSRKAGITRGTRREGYCTHPPQTQVFKINRSSSISCCR